MAQRYLSQDGWAQVELMELAAKAIHDQCRRVRKKETGGILIGLYSDDGSSVSIKEAIGPPPGSLSTATGFTRGDSGLTETARV